MIGTKLGQIGQETTVKDNLKDNNKKDHKSVFLSVHFERLRGLTGVALSDPGSMKFSHIIEQSPRDWETTLCQNIV